MLKRNDIVVMIVMDNCRVHLGPGIRQAIEKARATLRYLPKYSPDLNPIEMPYGLNRAIRSFIPQPSPHECANYFTHAGSASI
jgi:transposase